MSSDTVAPDLQAAEKAAADLLVALGLPVDTDALVHTPRRMAESYAELLAAPPVQLTTFPSAGYDELVVVEDLPVASVCEHHMLPFVGVAQIGYLPDGRILGLSKFARTVDFFARRAQTQERLTREVADYLCRELEPRGIGVVVQAEHSCMSLRGARAAGSRTVTSTLLGSLREDPVLRAEFLSRTQQPRGMR